MFNRQYVLLLADGYSNPNTSPAVANQGATRLDGYVLGVSANTLPAYIGNMKGFCVQVTTGSSGSPVFDGYIQYSTDGTGMERNDPNSDQLVNWTTDPDSHFTLAGSDNVMRDVVETSARWFRLKLTRTSGSATITATSNVKGDV